LKTRRVAGIDALILAHPERGSFCVSREWTDWGTPSAYDGMDVAPCRFDVWLLLDLVTLVERLSNPSSRSSSKGVD
jgi:hypothetical protein